MNESYEKAYAADEEFRKSRLKSLFADFQSLQETNPEGYIYNLNVWKRYLKRVFTRNDTFKLSYGDELMKELTYRVDGNVYVPKGLYIVLNDMINKDKDVMRLNKLLELEAKGDAGSDKGGILDALRRLFLGEATEDVRATWTKEEGPQNTLIYLPVLKLTVGKVKSIVSPILEEGVMNTRYIKLVLEENGTLLDDAELKIVLDYWSFSSEEVNFVDDEVLCACEKKTEVTSTEKEHTGSLRHLADLHYAIHKLTTYSEAKQIEINKYDELIRSSIRDKNMILAKSQLRLKKMVEGQLLKNTKNLENMQTLKIHVEEAHNNIMIAHIWKENASILKTLNNQSEATDLDEMMDELNEEIADTNAISDKLGKGISSENEDDIEIEEELMELEREIKSGALKESQETKEKYSLAQLEDKFSKLKLPENKPRSEKGSDVPESVEEDRQPILESS
jgi:charged multivesicular body protein 7